VGKVDEFAPVDAAYSQFRPALERFSGHIRPAGKCIVYGPDDEPQEELLVTRVDAPAREHDPVGGTRLLQFESRSGQLAEEMPAGARITAGQPIDDALIGRRYRQGRELAGETTRRRIRRWG